MTFDFTVNSINSGPRKEYLSINTSLFALTSYAIHLNHLNHDSIGLQSRGLKIQLFMFLS
jgi:hypothetical protein